MPLGIAWVDFRNDSLFEESLEDLIRVLLSKPRFAPPPLGTHPALSTSFTTEAPRAKSSQEVPRAKDSRLEASQLGEKTTASVVETTIPVQSVSVEDSHQAANQIPTGEGLTGYLPFLLGVAIAIGGWLDLYNNAISIPSWLTVVITLVTIFYYLWLFIEGRINKKKMSVVGVILLAIWVPKGLDALEILIQENVTWTIIAFISVGWLFLFWIYTSKKESEVWEGLDKQPKIEKLPQFPKGRRWALAGMILLPTLAALGFAIAEYTELHPSGKFTILVADFDGQETKHLVTSTVIDKLKRATAEFPEVEIGRLNSVITEQDGTETARILGKKHNANLVVWGAYDEALNGTIHIDAVREPNSLLPSNNAINFSAVVAEQSGMSAKEVLSGGLSHFVLLLTAYARYDVEDYDGAILRSSKAIEQTTLTQEREIQSNLLFLLGAAFLYKRDFSSAINSYEQLIKLKPNYSEAYYNLGLAYFNKEDYDRAIASLDHAIKFKPNYAEAYYQHGIINFIKDKYDIAMDDYNKAIELKPDFAFAFYNQGLVYERKGNTANAVTKYRKCFDIAKDTPIGKRAEAALQRLGLNAF